MGLLWKESQIKNTKYLFTCYFLLKELMFLKLHQDVILSIIVIAKWLQLELYYLLNGFIEWYTVVFKCFKLFKYKLFKCNNFKLINIKKFISFKRFKFIK